MNRSHAVLLCAALTGVSVQATKAELAIVKDGKALAHIVTAPDSAEGVKIAVEELRRYVQKMSGALLPVAHDPAMSGPRILVGVSDAALRQTLRMSELRYDGFIIDCDRKRLTLAGNVPEGTLNAVYAFLEDVCGVRWYLPTELGENVPTRRTIRVPLMRRRIEPRFVNRRNHGIDMSIRGDGAVWRRRVRITSHSLDVPFNRYSHNLYRVFPATQYGETHPEYYPLIAGRRRVPGKNHAQNWQPCTTSPEAVRLTVRAAHKWFRAHPRSNFFSVGMNDSGAFGKCTYCRTLDIPGETFRKRQMVSDRYFTFVKAVADAVAGAHPDKFVTCIAYSVVESPPKRIKLPSNVGVVITQDVAQWHDAAYKQADMEFARSWARAARAFGTYDYTGLTWLMPRVYPHLMAESLRFYDEVGAVAVTNEAFPTWWYAAPQLYLRARLMWDPRLDADAVLDEFYTGFFGPAGPAMKRFYNVLERCMVKPRSGRWFEGLGSVIQQLDLWERADADDCLSALREAKAAVGGHPRYEPRVAFVERGLAWAHTMLNEYWQAQRVERLATASGGAASQLLPEVRRLLGLTRERQAMWQRIRNDRLLSGIYRFVFDRRPTRLAVWRSYLQSAVSTGIARLTMQPGGLDSTQIRRLLGEIPTGTLADELRARLWVYEHPDAKNLCRNPGFEEAKAAGPAPKGIDWVATNTPPGWAKWALRPETLKRMTWEARGGRGGSRCVKIAGAQNACFIQSFRARPGERYYASAWPRAAGAPAAKIKLLVQWKDRDGKWDWSKTRREAALPNDATDWREVSVLFTVPPDVGYAVVLLAAIDQQQDDAAWFDDMRVVRLPSSGH